MMEPEFEDGVPGITYELKGVPNDFYDDVYSGHTIVSVSAAGRRFEHGKHGGGELTVQPGANVRKEKKRKEDRRRLAPKEGNSNLLILYAVPPDVQNNAVTPEQLANEVFGDVCNTGCQYDQHNVKSQMLACSRGKLNYVPASGHPEIVNGVLNVPISQNVAGVWRVIVENWVKVAANATLGTQNTSIEDFEQVMIVIPNEADWGGAAAAYAYQSGLISVFRDDSANRMGWQVHEFGHNIG